ncbi:uncharacterized protein LAESUDRAFT_756931 [Laetiporus sulphureus 93-53]|uniref:Uncharacterized protein n=1 Tax=Laetiporus sulphureus 93-53 TaxID=1314785 RepID=A0A165FQ15_9APHY|nr:uncharacterized protein LAESUDRAFT_756931 [Laetiporus sulphureus 93-53]KZT09302.1 hypothetical protein LAESUDRAFT_756931 [Laetiporus sulphureus 93-53]
MSLADCWQPPTQSIESDKVRPADGADLTATANDGSHSLDIKADAHEGSEGGRIHTTDAPALQFLARRRRAVGGLPDSERGCRARLVTLPRRAPATSCGLIVLPLDRLAHLL